MRLLAAALIVSLVLVPNAARADDLSAYAGKNGNDEIRGHIFTRNPTVKREVTRVLGRSRYSRILRHERRGEIVAISDAELGELLIAGQTNYEDVHDDSIVIMTASGSPIGICLSVPSAQGKRVEWTGSGWSKKVEAHDGCRGGLEADQSLDQFKAAKAAH